MTKDKKAGVVGAGLMGSDIAALLANAGYKVTLVDISKEALEKAKKKHEKETIEALEQAGIKKQENIVSSITYITELEELEDSSFIVEAIVDRLETKIDLMNSLEKVIKNETTIGTNTSTLTPSGISKGMKTPERVVLFHFANPPILRNLVEISGDKATEKAKKIASRVGKEIQKEPIILNKERRGHVLSRISAAIKCSASWLLLEAEPESIDQSAKALGFNRGPIELIDLIGIDLHLDTVSNLSVEYEDKFEPPEEVKERMNRMVDSGKLGKKTGEGFYKWRGDEPIIPETKEEADITPIIGALVNEAHKIVEDNISNRETVDKILKLGSGGSAGPFEITEMFGREDLIEVLEKRYRKTSSELFKPAETLKN